MLESDEVKEGFLCPICKRDLQSMVKLHTHFHEEHSDEIDIKKILKGVVGHAKKIIKQQNNDLDYSSSAKNPVKKETLRGLEIYDVPQEMGIKRSRMDIFKEIRNDRLEGFSAETNKLIIRLDKLITNIPTDPARKKLHEQTVVPWLDGEDVSRCPECTKTFHLARRKHHCRLCGSIMCNDCSCFLTLSKAKKIVSSSAADEHSDSENKNDAFAVVVAAAAATATATDSLRICNYCLNLLESRESMKDSRNCNPFISQCYEQIKIYVKEADGDMDMYNEMSLSLNEGRSTYHLQDAKDLWEKIMRLCEKISFLSAKIAALGSTAVPLRISNKQLKLQKAVSIGINGYIQSRILTLPALPSDETYRILQEKRRKKIEDEIREQKKEEITNSFLSSHIRTEYVYSKPTMDRMEKKVSADEGWIPDISNMYFNDNPIIQQMDNIRSYIKQAREAYKFDEVASLERNLHELQEEFYQQQQQQQQNLPKATDS